MHGVVPAPLCQISGAEALFTKPIDFKTLRSEIDLLVERAA